MSDEYSQNIDPGQPMVYQIRLKGHLGSQWADWFGELSITHEEDGNTLLIGPVVDQAALHGVLKRVRDLGLPLISINPLEPDRVEVTASGSNQSGSSELNGIIVT